MGVIVPFRTRYIELTRANVESVYQKVIVRRRQDKPHSCAWTPTAKMESRGPLYRHENGVLIAAKEKKNSCVFIYGWNEILNHIIILCVCGSNWNELAPPVITPPRYFLLDWKLQCNLVFSLQNGKFNKPFSAHDQLISWVVVFHYW